MPDKTLREHSQFRWTSKTGTVEMINAGSLQRIADGVELIGTSLVQLVRERDDLRTIAAQRLRQVQTLKGTVTRLKNELQRQKLELHLVQRQRQELQLEKERNACATT